MGLKAEIPDFIDDGSDYELTDIGGLMTKAGGLAAGTLVATVAVGSGYNYGRRATSWLANTAAGASQGASEGSDGGFDF